MIFARSLAFSNMVQYSPSFEQCRSEARLRCQYVNCQLHRSLYRLDSRLWQDLVSATGSGEGLCVLVASIYHYLLWGGAIGRWEHVRDMLPDDVVYRRIRKSRGQKSALFVVRFGSHRERSVLPRLLSIRNFPVVLDSND